MTRVVFASLILVAFPLHSFAEDAAVHLTVRPMRAPKPALKYQLLPEVRELKPGNAAQGYVKCFMEQRTFFFTKEYAADRTAIPDDAAGGAAVRQAAGVWRIGCFGRQTGRPGWIRSTGSFSIASRTAAMEVLPAELGPLQVLAAVLHVRFRAEVACWHFDDAIRSAKTMFAMSRHLGEHPTAIANLVGMSAATPEPRHPRRNGAAAGVSQPLLGVDRSALPSGGSAQGRAGRMHPGRRRN